jgi:hypothetical protein
MKTTVADPEKPELNICPVAAQPYMGIIKCEKLHVYAITLYEINKALGIMDLQGKSIEEVISKKYYVFLPLFGNVVAETLPPYWAYDYKIKL